MSLDEEYKGKGLKLLEQNGREEWKEAKFAPNVWFCLNEWKETV